MSTLTRRLLSDAPFLAAATGGSPNRRPVWFMRQAGRSLPEYRELRAGVGILESCFDPELVCEITLQPIRRHRVDAAILFSDIVVPLKAAGIDLDIVPGVGPVVANPVRTVADVRALPRLRREEVGAVTEGVRLLVGELGETPLIGFAGAPFTLASYLVEGGPSKQHERTKAMMLGAPDTWHALLGVLTDITIEFLRAQLAAGVDAVQLFDSWAGALSLAQYREFVLPYSERVFAEVAAFDAASAGPSVVTQAAACGPDAPAGSGVPRIHFGVGTGELLGAMGEAGADVVGVDWRVPLTDAVRRVGAGKALQGNLDPATLFAGPAVVEREVRRIAREADEAIAMGAAGHIFNLGHGVLPDTDPGAITAAVELIHSLPLPL
jgi:uroporphyrinogen decarboxylase